MTIDEAIKTTAKEANMVQGLSDTQYRHLTLHLALLRFVQAWDDNEIDSPEIDKARAAVDEALK